MMKEIIMILGHHPVVGSFLSVGQIILAYIIKGNIEAEIELPAVIMQLFQIGAWIGAIGVAIITILGWFKTHTTLLDKWKWLKEKK